MELHCKNCDTSCTDIEGEFGCLGISSKKTTVEEIINRVNEIYCKDCKPPVLSIESSCDTSNLQVNVTSLGDSSKVTIEIYKEGGIVALEKVTSTGLVLFNLPYGEYKIKAFNTYNFECSTPFFNFSHQCLSKPCVAPIVNVDKRDSPGLITINVASLGETTEVLIQVLKGDTVIFAKATSILEVISVPVSVGTYRVSISGKCNNGVYTTDIKTVNIIDHSCGVYLSGSSYDCTSNLLTLNPIGGSLQYEYSINNRDWYPQTSLLPIIRNSFLTVYVRDKNNTSCVYSSPFSSFCNCQLSFTVTNVQCNELGCKLSWNYSGVQCNNTLICTISGTIVNVQA